MTMPKPGSNEWESMIDFMRKDLESSMGYSKVITAAKKIVEDRGGNFNEEFEAWKEKNKK